MGNLGINIYSDFIPITTSSTKLFSLIVSVFLIEKDLVVNPNVELFIIPGINFPELNFKA